MKRKILPWALTPLTGSKWCTSPLLPASKYGFGFTKIRIRRESVGDHPKKIVSGKYNQRQSKVHCYLGTTFAIKMKYIFSIEGAYRAVYFDNRIFLVDSEIDLSWQFGFVCAIYRTRNLSWQFGCLYIVDESVLTDLEFEFPLSRFWTACLLLFKFSRTFPGAVLRNSKLLLKAGLSYGICLDNNIAGTPIIVSGPHLRVHLSCQFGCFYTCFTRAIALRGIYESSFFIKKNRPGSGPDRPYLFQ